MWLEPDTDMNLTVDFSIDQGFRRDHPQLTDQGGFSGHAFDYPLVDPNNTQSRPELWSRAFKGAVLSNIKLMIYPNESRRNTRMGKTYLLKSTSSMKLNRIDIGSLSNYPNIPGFFLDGAMDHYRANRSDKYLDAGKRRSLKSGTRVGSC